MWYSSCTVLVLCAVRFAGPSLFVLQLRAGTTSDSGSPERAGRSRPQLHLSFAHALLYVVVKESLLLHYLTPDTARAPARVEI